MRSPTKLVALFFGSGFFVVGGASGCTIGLSAFMCSGDQSCGAGQRCIDTNCATPDTNCASGFRWDSSAGARANLCTTTTTPPDLSMSGLDGPLGIVDMASGDLANGGGCNILGTVYSSGAPNPASPMCQVCNPAMSAIAWTNITDGTACTGGKCAMGVCCTGCIDAVGACHSGNTTHHCGVMANTCISCDDGNPCHANQCLGNGTCNNAPVIDGTACPGTLCGTGGDGGTCPGACAECAQQQTCTGGTCGGAATLVCCTGLDTCMLFGGRSFCAPPGGG